MVAGKTNIADARAYVKEKYGLDVSESLVSKMKRKLTKAKKKPGEETLKLVRTPDILEGLGARPQHPLLVGFAAETENVEQNAREKLARKNLDLIVANDVADAFGKDSNRVLVLGKDGARREIEGSKRTVAHAIWDMVRERLPG